MILPMTCVYTSGDMLHQDRPSILYEATKEDPSSDAHQTGGIATTYRLLHHSRRVALQSVPHSNHKQHLPNFCCCISLVPAPKLYRKRHRMWSGPFYTAYVTLIHMTVTFITDCFFLQQNRIPMCDLPLRWTLNFSSLQTYE